MSTPRPAREIPGTTERDLAALAAAYAITDALLERFAAHLAHVRTESSAWSAEHHLAHVALANELVLKNVKNLVRGAGMLVVRGGEPVPGAIDVLATGVIPRGKAQAPRMVKPPAAVDREMLVQWLADGRAELASLDVSTLVATELKIPHQILGPLDAPQWLRFGAVHSRHHLVIAYEVLGVHVEASALPKLPDV